MADIKENRFYKIVMDKSLSSEEKKDLIAERLLFGNSTYAEYADAEREFKELKTYLEAESKRAMASMFGEAAAPEPAPEELPEPLIVDMILNANINVRSRPLTIRPRAQAKP